MKREPLTFALIAFGNLGMSASISLKSILGIGVSRICFTGDRAGIDWMQSQMLNSSKDILCLHEISPIELKKLNLNYSTENQYTNFGQERFIKLTTFKWFLLQSILIQHSSTTSVIFSDLDVYWLNVPSLEKLFSAEPKNQIAFLQNDTPKGASAIHFCTVIMFWVNTDESVKALRELYQSQFSTALSGHPIPDEPIFNSWFRSYPSKWRVKPLDSELFVIGHRFFNLLLKKRSEVQAINAFHANYVIGDKAKLRRLRTVEMKSAGNWKWIILYLRELSSKLSQKYLLGR